MSDSLLMLPEAPPPRILYQSLLGPLMFNSWTEYREWKTEKWWKKLFGITKYNKRIDTDYKNRLK